MPSRVFRQLEKEIARLDAQYLPSIVKPLGYTIEEQEMVRAYYVFTHAACVSA